MVFNIDLIVGRTIDIPIRMHPNMQIEFSLLPLSLASALICDILLNPSVLSHVPPVLIIDHVADHDQLGDLDQGHDSSAIYKPIERVLESWACLVSKHKIDSLGRDQGNEDGSKKNNQSYEWKDQPVELSQRTVALFMQKIELCIDKIQDD